MLDAQGKAGLAFGVAQNMRYYESLHVMRQWIAEGRIGAPLLGHSQFCYNAEGSPRQWIYDPTLALGGPIGDVAIHCIDALRFVLGGTHVAEVSTLAHTDALSGPVESHAVVALNFSSGTMGAVTVTTRGDYRSYVEVTGEDVYKRQWITCMGMATRSAAPTTILLKRGPLWIGLRANREPNNS